MQISDLMGQYHQVTASPTEKLTGTKGVENLVSSLRSLTRGNIFEGTVSSVKNGKVTLALSNGQQIMARMDAKITLSVGQSMFFQVKSNDGSQIAIRPFVLDGSGANYALMQALSAAGLPAESHYLSMVNRMMEEQMPIDRASLQQMARVVNANSGIDVQTLVQMQKLGIPITPENAAQFENYLDDRQAITKEMDLFMEELPKILSGDGLVGEEVPVEQMRSMGSNVLAVVVENLPDVPDILEYSAISEKVNLSDSLLPSAEEPVQTNGTILPGEEQLSEKTQVAETVSEQAGSQNSVGEEPISVQSASQEVQPMQTPHTLGAVLSPEQIQDLNQMVGQLLGVEETAYTKDSGVVEVLRDLQQVFQDPIPLEKEPFTKLTGSKTFQALIKDTLEQQWMVKPEELPDKEQIGKLYERLNSQMERIEHAMKAVGQEHSSFAQTAADIRSNVNFMNQINQVYTYVQLPLKMSDQHASGELYVYTNKQALAEGKKELTAFLHLDLDHLGSTDVSVRMMGKEVSTSFYLENDEAYDLIERNYPVLEARLQKKGFHCTVSVVHETKKVNFVEDFLKKDQPSAGQLHRYSFDMRA